MAGIASIVLGGIALVVIVLLAARHGTRTWTDDEYEELRSSGTTLGNAFLATQAIFEPGAQHVLEERTSERAEQIDAEGPPDPSGDRHPH
jgi:hypothetical protein